MIDENLIPFDELIPLDKIPDELDFVKDGIASVISDLFIGEFTSHVSIYKENAHYRFKIIAFKKIGFEFPGSNGMQLVVNPSTTQANYSDFYVSFGYTWPVLKYFSEFDLSSFDYSPRAFFDILITIISASQGRILESLIDSFYDWTEVDNNGVIVEKSPIENFVYDFNYNKSPNTALLESLSATDIYDDLIQQMETNGNSFDIIEILFTDYILDSNVDVSLDNVMIYFSNFLGNITIYNVKDIIIPKISAELESLNLALEFPRNILIPLDQFGQVISDESIKAKIIFNVGRLFFSSNTGFEFENESSFSLCKSQLGNSGLVIEFTGAKVDLSKTSNIPEATIDGRPNSFKGIFIEQGIITLPPDWVATEGSTNPQIITNNLLVGTEGGVSGKITVDGVDYETSVDFVINGLSSIAYDSNLKLIKITKSANEEYQIEHTEGQDTLIRDISRKLYKVDSAGIVSLEVSSPPVTGILNFKITNSINVALDSFSLEFYHNEIVSGSVIGSITFGSLEDGGQPVVLNISIDFSNGFNIKVFSIDGQPIVDNSFLQIMLNGLEIGKQESLWKLGFAGSITNKTSFPAIGDIIPSKLSFNKFLLETGEPLEYDMQIDWPGGLSIKGTDEEGISAYLPIKKSLGGFASIDGIRILIDDNLTAGTDIIVELENAGLKLGPCSVKVDGFGMKANVVEATSGNLGPFEVDFELIPPTGLSISIESSVLSGGGFLAMDAEEGSYMGGLTLAFSKFSLSAIGILNTKMPDGSEGFSLLIIITASFGSGIPIGMNFNLKGVGGLLGIHRTVMQDPMREGVKNGTLDMILFPTPSVIQNNPLTLIGNVATIFPVKENHYVFGPMAKISWGTRNLITLDFGILLEVPDPTLYILGVLKAALKIKDKPLINLQINFLGILDFKKKELSFYASLYCSKLLSFNLTGDMAVLMNWSDSPFFLISAGGFHPSYKIPPSNLPALQRIGINMAEKENLSLKFEAYFAITSNTAQFGAKMDFDARSGKFFIRGNVGTDVLIQFSPFYFITSLYFSVEAGKKDKVYLTASVLASLEGPNAWHIWGKAEFKILCVGVSISFDELIGTRETEVQGSINITNNLINSLKENDNWEAIVPDNYEAGVTFTEFDAAEFFAYPNASLQVNQTYLPFGLLMEKFGSSKLGDAKKFNISDVKVEGVSISKNLRKDFFSEGEYTELTKEEKLTKKSFELFDSGVIIGDELDIQTASALVRDLTKNDTIIVMPNVPKKPRQWQNGTLNLLSIDEYEAFTGAKGFLDNNDSTRGIGVAVDELTTVTINDILEESYSIAKVDDLSGYDNQNFATNTEAEQYLLSIIESNPELEEDLIVVEV